MLMLAKESAAEALVGRRIVVLVYRSNGSSKKNIYFAFRRDVIIAFIDFCSQPLPAFPPKPLKPLIAYWRGKNECC